MMISSLAAYPLSQLRAGLERLTGGSSTDSTASTSTSSVNSTSDSNQLSPFARILSSLQQLQQSDPAKYQQVTASIAANLKSAASTATANGNTTAAQTLTQLSNDFQDASSSGQLPSVQDLAKALHHGGGHHHHHQTSSSTASTSQDLSPYLSTTDSTDPMSTLLNTLEQSGLSTS